MATTLARRWTLSENDIASAVLQTLQAATFDDVVVMAVLAILSAVYLVRGTLWDRPDPHLYKMFERPQEKMGSKSVAAASRDVSERMHQVVSLAPIDVSTAAADTTQRAQISSSSGALNPAPQNVLHLDWLRRSSNVMVKLYLWQTCLIMSRTQ